MNVITESERDVRISGEYDLVVCGAGPAGVSAAVAAAREGLRTLLLEEGGALGGVWTRGMLCLVLDVGSKSGLMREIREGLERMGAAADRFSGPSFTYDVEAMKLLLESMCEEAGVHIRLHTRVVGCAVSDRRLRAVMTESCQGREAFAAALFVDATGNGELAWRAGCGFERGHPQSGKMQPATLLGIVSGVPESALRARMAYEANGIVTREEIEAEKQSFRELLRRSGFEPSYQSPTLFPLPLAGLTCLMINHEYGVSCDDADQMTQATIRARSELHRAVRALRANPEWGGLALVATAEHIGIREGRRIRGRFRITLDDLASGRRFEDGVCLVEFGVDIHSLEPGSEKRGYSSAGATSIPYHIPYRALVSESYDNLAMAGRCISGDFFAHASYRVTGNAVPMGEAVGIAAGEALRLGPEGTFADVDGRRISESMKERGYRL